MKIKIEVEKCLVPDCGRQAKHRGLCHKHYMKASRLIATKKTSWAKLEKSGKCFPSRQGMHPGDMKTELWFLGK